MRKIIISKKMREKVPTRKLNRRIRVIQNF